MAAGAVVCVALERSVDALVAVLGILKAGAAYLPVDPAFPADRIRFMLDDADARVVAYLDTVSRLGENGLGGVGEGARELVALVGMRLGESGCEVVRELGGRLGLCLEA